MSTEEFNPYNLGYQPGASGSQATLQGSPYLHASGGSLPASSQTSFPREYAPLLKEEGSYESSPLGTVGHGYILDSEKSRRRPIYKTIWFWLVVVVVVAAAVVLPIYFLVIKPKHHDGSAQAASSNSTTISSSSGTAKSAIKIGGDGSIVTKDDGTTFVYNNSFGGYWVSNPEDPFDNSARPNAWTPPLNESWRWGQDRIHGVNLGGLFVPEPFIVPSLFEANPGAVDEWTLSTILAGKGQLQNVMEEHYDTFITEEDIAQIAGAGLNWIRLPIPFWAVDTWSDVGVDGQGQTVSEPFLARVCWKYILRLIGWARKYGLRVLLDLHTIPGSQNGYNHSGKLGSLNWLNGPMGLANAERSLDYIRSIAEFISQPEYRDVVQIFGILNEPFLPTIGREPIESFYLRAYEMVRNITGTGEGNGPIISFHDGFDSLKNWAGFLSGADRIAIDDHPYFAFDGQPNREPVNVTADGGDGTMLGGKWPLQACNAWGASMNQSMGDGWFDAQDTAPAVTPIAGCAYPNAWDAVNAQIPLSGCLPAPTA
ncbi:hypothetical protein BN946_scf184994.g45 [Trametes cinnabarina]|uniref:glucan 1,3-beta-glucosidase n=1 Tax=Pycnoporus cinnabarinus TaxID=5643 RepID=A0A060SEB4_PYCCI|nr:hypothetical protein BN946_scf184994.g45 [Trametes cinnabarina]